VARKDRERARRRHQVERARRAAGLDTKSPDAEGAEGSPRRSARSGSRTRPSPSRPGGASGSGARAPLRKLQVGERDRRGRVFERNMILHPRVAMQIYVVVLGLAILSLLKVQLRAAGYAAFAIGMLVIADGQPTKRRALVYVVLAVALTALAIVVTLATPKSG
jgi:hypothetical protein